jgi:hypothetical protein
MQKKDMTETVAESVMAQSNWPRLSFPELVRVAYCVA